ncbi:MAG TPA: AAA family ATPase [Arenimonas sp.]|nr:AAA family ATPase [Arenimonas sp.]
MDSKKIILHDHYNRAFTLAEDFIKGKIKGKNIMLIIGPTGVGKTTLRHQLLRKWYGNPMDWPSGKLRAVEVMATQTENAYFKSSALAESIHRELFSPDLRFLKPIDAGNEYDSYCKSQMELADIAGLSVKYRNITETRIWPILIKLAKQREVEMISIEHADALSKNHANQQPAEHMRNLMSVNETIGSRLILTSATNGYKLWQGDREVCDRMYIVPLYPYDLGIPAESLSFMKLLLAISSSYEFEPTDLFKSMYQEIAAVTGTTVRDIVSLFDMAKLNAAHSMRTKIRKSDLMTVMPSFADCKDIHFDIELFRSKVKPCSAKDLKLLIDKHVTIK